MVKTKGLNVLPRKDHCSAIFGQSLLVYGGQFENNTVSNEMLNFDLEFNDWGKLHYRQSQEGIIKGACCSVLITKK